jgi:DNA primase
LVEGPFDAMSCQQAGLPAVALQGMQLRREQKEMIERAAVGHLLLMLDQTALDNALRLASELGRQRCTIARLPKKDPNACSKEEIIDAALGAISWHDASLLSSREKVSAR